MERGKRSSIQGKEKGSRRGSISAVSMLRQDGRLLNSLSRMRPDIKWTRIRIETGQYRRMNANLSCARSKYISPPHSHLRNLKQYPLLKKRHASICPFDMLKRKIKCDESCKIFITIPPRDEASPPHSPPSSNPVCCRSPVLPIPPLIQRPYILIVFKNPPKSNSSS